MCSRCLSPMMHLAISSRNWAPTISRGKLWPVSSVNPVSLWLARSLITLTDKHDTIRSVSQRSARIRSHSVSLHRMAWAGRVEIVSVESSESDRLLRARLSSTFVFNTSLTANSSSVSVTDAVLAAKQNGNIDVVSINEVFSLSLIVVDRTSQIKLGNIQWGGFTWSATVSLYGLLQYASNGSLNNVGSSSIVVDTTAGTITANNLTINDTGMYIVKVQLRSSNNLYNITLTSNGILVKKSTSKWRNERFLP